MSPVGPRIGSLLQSLGARLPRRRTTLKIVHWSVLPLLVWFILVTPDDVRRFGSGAVRFHSVLGLIFVSLALGWSGHTLHVGLASRPGPKLPPWARRVHGVLHPALLAGLFGVALTGFALGVTSAVQLWAGGIVPIGIPLGVDSFNRIAGQVHIAEFYALAGLVIAHAGFHIWRHVALRDNALAIMAPRRLRRYL